MKYGKVFVLISTVVLIVLVSALFSISRIEFFNIGKRVRSNCDGNLSDGKGTKLLDISRSNKQNKIQGSFIEKCGNCTFNNSKSDPSKIAMTCACKKSDGTCSSSVSTIDLNIGNIYVSPEGNLVHSVSTTAAS